MRMLLLSGSMAMLGLVTACADAPPQSSAADGKPGCHPDKVAQAEAEAKRMGKQLMWVNCPQPALRTS